MENRSENDHLDEFNFVKMRIEWDLLGVLNQPKLALKSPHNRSLSIQIPDRALELICRLILASIWTVSDQKI